MRDQMSESMKRLTVQSGIKRTIGLGVLTSHCRCEGGEDDAGDVALMVVGD